jgi:glycosyltransferase involved in cell wall biosynthesis
VRIGAGAVRHPSILDPTLEGMHAMLSTRLFEGACVDRAGLDLSHGNMNYLPITAGKTKRVVTVHDTIPRTHPERCRHGSVVSFLRQEELRQDDEVVVVSKASRADFEAVFEHPQDRVHINPPGVDLGYFQPAAGAPDGTAPDPEGGFLLSVGQVEPRKNHLGALAAFERVAPRHEGLRWRVVGPRAMGWEAFAAALDRSPVKDRVDIVPLVTDDGLREAYRQARALVFPSLSEGFGQPVLEALACGCPVVSAAGVPALDAVGEAVVTCDPSDPASIAEAVEEAAYGQGAARRARGLKLVANCAWSRNAGNYLRIYARALDRPVEDLLRPGQALPG